MAVDWTEVAYVAGGALITSLLGSIAAPRGADASASGTFTPTRPASCVRMPRFVRMNGECHNVVDDIVMRDFWCEQQETAPASDSFWWPWSHPECK